MARNKRSREKKRDIRLAAAANYRIANREKLREDARSRKQAKVAAMSTDEMAEHRRLRTEGKRIHRAKKYGSGGRHSEAEWQALLDACGRRCVACGIGEPLTRDHIVPLTRGGTDAISNIQPLCKSCNSSKNRWHTTDYRTGESVACLEAKVANTKCNCCGSVFRMTNIRKKFCSRKCGYTASNRRASAKRAKAKALSSETV